MRRRLGRLHFVNTGVPGVEVDLKLARAESSWRGFVRESRAAFVNSVESGDPVAESKLVQRL